MRGEEPIEMSENECLHSDWHLVAEMNSEMFEFYLHQHQQMDCLANLKANLSFL